MHIDRSRSARKKRIYVLFIHYMQNGITNLYNHVQLLAIIIVPALFTGPDLVL